MNSEFEQVAIAAFNKTAACYLQSDFEDFAKSIGLSGKDNIDLIRDVILTAGAMYRQTAFLDKKLVAGKKTLQQIKKTETAARNLIDCLDDLSNNQNARNTLKSVTKVRKLAEQKLGNATWSGQQYVDDIFISDDTSKLHPYQILTDKLIGLERSLRQVKKENLVIEKVNRQSAIEIWIADMSFFWLRKSGEFVPTGHYYKEAGDYSSESLALLICLLQKIDPKASQRAILNAIRRFKTLAESPDNSELLGETILSSLFLPTLVKADLLEASVNKWAEYMHLSPKIVGAMWDVARKPPATNSRLGVKEKMQEIIEATNGNFSDR